MTRPISFLVYQGAKAAGAPDGVAQGAEVLAGAPELPVALVKGLPTLLAKGKGLIGAIKGLGKGGAGPGKALGNVADDAAETVPKLADAGAPKAPVVFENQFPSHVIEPPRQVYQPWQLKNMQGRTLNYVVTDEGKLIIGRIDRAPGGGHIDLAGGRPVQAAGEVVIRNGQIKYLDNASGHYLPNGPAAQEAAEQAFRNAGFDSTGKYIEKVWDPQKGWIPVGGQ